MGGDRLTGEGVFFFKKSCVKLPTALWEFHAQVNSVDGGGVEQKGEDLICKLAFFTVFVLWGEKQGEAPSFSTL